MNAGQWAEAEGHFRSELALNPVNAKARYNLGVTLFALNRREEAQAEWLRLLRQEPDDLAAMAALVRSYSSAGRPELADRWRRELERRGIRLE
jgi:pentatricopeptide repeat protein